MLLSHIFRTIHIIKILEMSTRLTFKHWKKKLFANSVIDEIDNTLITSKAPKVFSLCCVPPHDPHACIHPSAFWTLHLEPRWTLLKPRVFWERHGEAIKFRVSCTLSTFATRKNVLHLRSILATVLTKLADPGFGILELNKIFLTFLRSLTFARPQLFSWSSGNALERPRFDTPKCCVALDSNCTILAFLFSKVGTWQKSIWANLVRWKYSTKGPNSLA